MYNSFDFRQTQSLVEYRRKQVAADSARYRTPVQRGRRAGWLERVRVTIGTGLIRAGARIAGVYPADQPHLRHGV